MKMLENLFWFLGGTKLEHWPENGLGKHEWNVEIKTSSLVYYERWLGIKNI